MNTADPTLTELAGRIHYYTDELLRLREEQKRDPETTP